MNPSFPRAFHGALVRSLNPSNVAAGLSVIAIYAAGPFPFYLATVANSGFDASIAQTGLILTFLTAGVATIAMSFFYHQPLPLGWSMQGLIYLTAASQHYAVEELAGACLVTALVLIGLAITGSAERLARSLPVPLVMAVLAGSAVHYCTGIFTAMESSLLVAGVPVAAYFGARAIARPWLPPIAVALAAGLPFALLSGTGGGPAMETTSPQITPLLPVFRVEAIFALVPILVASTVVGNVQGFAILEMNGFRPPRNPVTLTTGMLSFIHALIAAPPATMQRSALAMLAGDESGPAAVRHYAAVIASIGAIVLAVFAVSVASAVTMLSPAFVTALVGLVLYPVVLEALQRALASDRPHGAFIAFALAASGVSIGGLDAALWGLIGGFAVTALMERQRPSEV